MQLNLHDNSDHNAVRHYDAESVTINETRFESSLLVMPDGVLRAWSVSAVAELDEAAALPLIELEPEVVIVGTGHRQVFPDRAFLRSFLTRGIGCEIMDTGAACRTYNVLAEEERRVLGALMLGG